MAKNKKLVVHDNAMHTINQNTIDYLMEQFKKEGIEIMVITKWKKRKATFTIIVE